MEKRKTTLPYALGAAAALGVVLFLVFRTNGAAILESLRRVPPAGLAGLLALALGGPLLEGAAVWQVLRVQRPDLPLGRAVTAAFLGIFGNVATLGVGTIPMQSWYLGRFGVLPGAGAGLLTLSYTIQKTAILLYATLMLLAQGVWLHGAGLSRYLLGGYAVCALIIAALLLLCTWGRVQDLALWVVDRLPETGSWPVRKAAWRENVEALRTQSKALLADRGRCARVMGLYLAKCALLYTLAWVCVELLGLEGMGFAQCQLLCAVTTLIAGAIPNVGGMGPAEFAFCLLFTPGLGEVGAASAMVLYRFASYFFPFLLSVPFVLLLPRSREKG